MEVAAGRHPTTFLADFLPLLLMFVVLRSNCPDPPLRDRLPRQPYTAQRKRVLRSAWDRLHAVDLAN